MTHTQHTVNIITCSLPAPPNLMHKTTHPCPCGSAHLPLPNPKNDVVPAPIPSLRPHRHEPRRRLPAAFAPPLMVTTVAAAASSWVRRRRMRYLFLLLCSPLLLVLLCAALPFLCAGELCLRRRLWRKPVRESGDDEGLRRCEEGCCGCGGDEEKGLLHRYLEDQLLLVGSMYECGDDEDEEEPEREEDARRVEDVENPGSSRIPLLR